MSSSAACVEVYYMRTCTAASPSRASRGSGHPKPSKTRWIASLTSASSKLMIFVSWSESANASVFKPPEAPLTSAWLDLSGLPWLAQAC